MSDKSVSEVIAGRLMARRDGISADESKKDGAKLCLAVEGNGMRGIVSFGMLMALCDLDMLDLFDSYVGISAGGLNLAYTLTGQQVDALNFYMDDIAGKDFVNLMRFHFEERSMVDMHRLERHMLRKKPLAVTKLSPKYATSFKLATANVTSNQGELIYVEKVGHAFDKYLLASSILPFIQGVPWEIGNNKYYDGNTYYVDSVLTAEDIQASHMLVLYGRPQDKPLQSQSEAIDIRANRLSKYAPGSGVHYKAALQAYDSLCASLPFGETEFQNMRVYRHALPHAIGVGSSTVDQTKLVSGLKAGYQSILDLYCRTYKVGLMPAMVARR